MGRKRWFLFLSALSSVALLVPLGPVGAAPSGLAVSQSTAPQWARTFPWSISKTATPESAQIPSGGGSATAEWTVTVVKGSASDSYALVGEACLTNAGTGPTSSLAIKDIMNYKDPISGRWRQLLSVNIDVSAHPVLMPGETHCYPVAVGFVPLSGATEYRNTVRASATISGSRAVAKSLTAFGLPGSPILVNDSITVSDSNGQTWVTGSSASWSYTTSHDTVGTVTNAAVIAETGQQATATFEVLAKPCATVWDAVAFWCFDDQADPAADGADGHDAALFGAGFSADTYSGQGAALQVDGVDDYAWVPDPNGAENLDGFTAITLAAWIKADTVAGGPHEIVNKYASGGPYAPGGSGSGVAWGLDVQNGLLRFVYNWEEFEPSSAVIETDSWTHVAGTWDGNDVTLYIDGVQVAFGDNIFTAIPDTDTPVNIGAAEANVSGNRFAFFDGLIDDVFIFDRVLAPADIARLAGLTATDDWHADVVVQWLEEGGNTRHSLRWSPGLGFEATPLDDECISTVASYPVPDIFPYEEFSVSYIPDEVLRFDFQYPLRSVNAYLHSANGSCRTPDLQGGGLPADIWYFQFDLVG